MLITETQFPLKDGQLITLTNGTKELVVGGIKPEHNIPGGVCYTRNGNWYRRSDGKPMTGVVTDDVLPIDVAMKIINNTRYST